MNRRSVQVALIIVGAVLVLGHLVALVLVGATLSDWLGGTAVGLVLALLGGVHLLLAQDRTTSKKSRWQQTLFGLVALAVGIGEGLFAAFIVSGWWLLLPWALTALAIGMLLTGPPKEKAARLAAFGFSSALVFTASTLNVSTVASAAAVLAWALLGGAGAVAIGAAAHTVLSKVHSQHMA